MLLVTRPITLLGDPLMTSLNEKSMSFNECLKSYFDGGDLTKTWDWSPHKGGG